AASIGGSYGDIPLLQAWMSSVFDAPPPALQGVGTTAFTMKQNLLRIQMENGSGPESRLGPIMFNVDVMHGEAWALFVKLIGIDFVPPHSPLRIPMLTCNALGLPTGLNEVVAGPNGEGDVVAWPFFPAPVGNLHFSGVLAPLV